MDQEHTPGLLKTSQAQDRRAATAVILCADDFGLSPSVSAGILELARQGRISATSCMVNFGEVEAFKALGDLMTIDVGLHFTLTDFSPISPEAQRFFKSHMPSSGQLFQLTLKRAIPEDIIRCELKAQFNTLCERLGRYPDYIDGHHHIHQFPVISRVVAEFCSQISGGDHQIYVRTTSDKIGSIIKRGIHLKKSLFLHALGQGLAKRLQSAGMPTTTSFSGTYDFSVHSDYPSLFRRMLKFHQPNGLIMCHPGHVDELLRSRDSATESRHRELVYLSSPEFLIDLTRSNVEISRHHPG